MPCTKGLKSCFFPFFFSFCCSGFLLSRASRTWSKHPPNGLAHRKTENTTEPLAVIVVKTINSIFITLVISQLKLGYFSQLFLSLMALRRPLRVCHWFCALRSLFMGLSWSFHVSNSFTSNIFLTVRNACSYLFVAVQQEHCRTLLLFTFPLYKRPSILIPFYWLDFPFHSRYINIYDNRKKGGGIEGTKREEKKGAGNKTTWAFPTSRFDRAIVIYITDSQKGEPSLTPAG